MKSQPPKSSFRLIATLALAGGLVQSAPLGTSFTYQGRLNGATQPASGSYDFRFALYDAAEAGNLVGGPLTNAATLVSNGVFTATLDFGAGVFGGNARWLDIGVRTNGGGAFEPLSPRQALSPSPYALYAPGAGSAARASRVADNAVTAAGIAGGEVVKSLNSLHDAVTLAAGTNVTLNTSGNVLTFSATPGSVVTNAGWGLSGNTGTTPNNFVGTTDGAPLEMRVNSVRALRLEPSATSPNVIGGYRSNSASAGLYGVTVGGGGAANRENSALTGANYGTIGGGNNNTIQGYASFIGGGRNNITGPGSSEAVLGGGYSNTNNSYRAALMSGQYNIIQSGSDHAFLGAGLRNEVDESFAAVLPGGESNRVSAVTLLNATFSADYSTVAGGSDNSVQGSRYSFVGGGKGNTTVLADWSVLGGGASNRISGDAAFIGAGKKNTNAALSGVVGGGQENVLQGELGTIGGGKQNNISSGALSATIGGGAGNSSTGDYATIPGGYANMANGTGSFAAGRRATANHAGSFVWGDGLGETASSAAYQFIVHATGGLTLNTDSSLSSDAPKGISLKAEDRPLITRAWDPFNASATGEKGGLGRWGLFMEPYHLVAGIPDADAGDRAFAVWAYRTDGTHDSLFWVRNTDGMAWFSNNVSVGSLTVRGGADVAEPFTMSCGHVPRGGVVVIDDARPGRLKLSERAYDKRVAGVVSGANGIQPGLSLSQEGLMEGGQNVALSGRVYVQADAGYGPIAAGDQLTTSDTPGHAMRVSDGSRAQGAILGKAMSTLDQGRGFVLVLVTLQ